MIYRYRNLDLAVTLSKSRSERFKKLTLGFGSVARYLTSSTVIQKSISFKGCFNQATIYEFRNFCQGKVCS